MEKSIAYITWNAMIAEEASARCERENEADSHCGPYGTSKPHEYVEQVTKDFEAIGKAYVELLKS